MFCIECGTRIVPTKDFCPGCGLSLNEMMYRHARRPQWRILPPLRSSLAIFSAMLVPIGAVTFIVALIIDNELAGGPRTVHDFIVGAFCITAAGTEVAALIC
jgi:hypothetical protein